MVEQGVDRCAGAQLAPVAVHRRPGQHAELAGEVIRGHLKASRDVGDGYLLGQRIAEQSSSVFDTLANAATSVRPRRSLLR